MPRANLFFDQQKFHSHVKSTIVSKYFYAWSKVMIGVGKRTGSTKLAYVDLFCGPGKYEDGSISTPIMVLERATQNPELAACLLTMFNDRDPRNVESLKTEISKIPGISSLRYTPEVFCTEVNDELRRIFDGTALCPTFSFVDPFGYKGLSGNLIKAIIKDWGSDCVFFFNYSRINAGLHNRLVERHVEALFGKSRANQLREVVKNLSPESRETYILEELAKSLKDLGAGFVLPFRFKRPDGKRTSHALVFVSKNAKGYSIMKEIMARESSTIEQGVPSLTYSPAAENTPLLFSLNRPLESLKNDLCKTYRGQTLTMKEIFESHNIDTPFIERNYRAVLNQLEDEGSIIAYKPAHLRKVIRGERTFPGDTLVTFPSKEV